MKDRFKILRKTLKLSQNEIGEKLGVTRSAISRLESGDINFTEQMTKSICREFNVDYIWLTTGKGEMFADLPETIIDELCIQYDLDEDDRKIITEYIKLDKNVRNALKQYIKNVFSN